MRLVRVALCGAGAHATQELNGWQLWYVLPEPDCLR